MITKPLMILCLLTVCCIGAYAQSTCSCSEGDGGCTASQTCPAGKIAHCACSPTGCSSSCQDEEIILEFTETDFEKALVTGNPKTLRQFFSKSIGKVVEFVPSSDGSKLSYPLSKNSHTSHWDALEFLARNGELKLNGHNLAFWTGVRDAFLNGGAYTICTSRADVALNELSFISGKKFSVISGDPRTKLDVPIKGNGLEGMLHSLSKAANIEIAER